jgi:hypothetical protein
LLVPAKNGNTTGLAKHIQNDHKISPQAVRDFDLERDDRDEGQMQKYLHRTQSTLKIQKKKYTFREFTARLIAKKYLPFSFLENDRQLVKDWLQSYAVESSKNIAIGRKTVAQDIVNLAYEFQNQLKVHWASKEVGNVSIGLDCWTAPNRQSYFGVTASWIDEDWNLRRGVIGMEYFDPPHTGERMAQLLAKILGEYGLKVKDIMTLVCDNASNNKTLVDALVPLGFEENRRLRCVLHVLNLAAKAALRVFDRPTEKRSSPRPVAARKPDDDEDDDEDDEDVVDDDDLVGDVNEEYVQEILANIDGSYLPSVMNCRDFVRTIRNSSHYEKQLKAACVTSDINYNALVPDMPVRWNSTYRMIMYDFILSFSVNTIPSSVLRMQTPILQLQANFPNLNVLEAGDWKNLNVLRGLLGILHKGELYV